MTQEIAESSQSHENDLVSDLQKQIEVLKSQVIAKSQTIKELEGTSWHHYDQKTVVMDRDILEPTTSNVAKMQEIFELDREIEVRRNELKAANQDRERLLTINFVRIL